MALKSNPSKRNTYKDKDGNLMKGYTLPEVLDKTLTILAKREYVWGLFDGLAVKVKTAKGKLVIIEITAQTPIEALKDPRLPKIPFLGRFIKRTSKSGNDYYTVQAIDPGGKVLSLEDSDEPLPF